MIADEFLSILCCPETKQGLLDAEPFLVEKINQRIEKRELKTRGGALLEQKIEGGLLRADKKFLYAIRNDIPVMLIDESIPLTGLL